MNWFIVYYKGNAKRFNYIWKIIVVTEYWPEQYVDHILEKLTKRVELVAKHHLLFFPDYDITVAKNSVVALNVHCW